jgi:NAD(P)-dependent dehydrogenase (short-subunit alcohol dehydrogenase family)
MPIDQTPMKEPGRPAAPRTACVMLADPRSSYVSGSTMSVTGGEPII